MPPHGVTAFDAAGILQQNAHQNFSHNFKPGHSYSITVTGNDIAAYNQATTNIQWVIQEAINNNVRLRAMGSNWALSAAASSDAMINTKGLNLRFKPQASWLHNAYIQSGKTVDDALFVQCGCMIWDLNKYMETELVPRRCLRASGGSNGQTIAGATSTGTHGAALYTGSVHDAIIGLHIVTGPGSHVWLERASKPVASDSFINSLGAVPIRNDEMFNAAVVSFGSFGVIHGIMIETEPIYRLAVYESTANDKNIVPYSNEIRSALAALDINRLRQLLPGFPAENIDNKLYHFEVSANLNKMKKEGKKEIVIHAFFKQPCPDNYIPVHDFNQSKSTYSKDTMGAVSAIVDSVGAIALLMPFAVNQLFYSGLRDTAGGAKTIGEMFRYTRFRGKIASAAMAVDAADAVRVLDIMADVNKQLTLPGGVALRYVKGTGATLGFTKFTNSCVVEMDGLDTNRLHEFITKVWNKLEEPSVNIPYTLHWGKFNYILNPARVRRMYGDAKVDSWLNCRRQLLGADARRVFTNDFMVQCGLVNVETPPVPPPPVIT